MGLAAVPIGAAVLLCVWKWLRRRSNPPTQLAGGRRAGSTLLSRARVAAELRPADASDRGCRARRRGVVARGQVGRLPRAAALRRLHTDAAHAQRPRVFG